MYPNSIQTPSLLSRILSLKDSIKWGELLDGTKKTLDVISQAIPIYYQVKPIVSNAKTLFKIAGAINSNSADNNDNSQANTNTIKKEETLSSDNSPIFYL